MLLGFQKQAWETFTIAGDFEDMADTGETAQVSGSSVEAIDCDGTDVAATVLDAANISVSGTQLWVPVQAGVEASSPYKITFKIMTSLANQYEVDVYMHVKEE